MLEPSRAFYMAVFGTMKLGAIAVPLFTLFGPDGVKLRVDDCTPRLLVTNAEKAELASGIQARVVVADTDFMTGLARLPTRFAPTTTADALAIFQYTSGTTRELPEAVKHTHRSIVTLMVAALYGTGLRPGDRFFCPSSPAWGHGPVARHLAPLALGITIGAYAGRFDAERLLKALQDHRFTNISAAATHYRMMRNSGAAPRYRYALQKLSFTGEPIDSETAAFAEPTFGHPPCSMYGTTEIGVILVSYPGAKDFVVKPGSLGKPIPGGKVEVQDPNGSPVPARRHRRTEGLAPRRLDRDQGPRPHRRGRLLLSRRPGRRRHHLGRLDDERRRDRGRDPEASPTCARSRRHRRAGCAARPGGEGLRGRRSPGRRGFRARDPGPGAQRLSQHEYPRLIAFVTELPKTPAGKVHRKVLRERELAGRTAY